MWSIINSTTKDASLNYVENTGLASLIQYSFGSGIVINTPLTWGRLSASCKRGQIEIKWTTLQESGVGNFIVQRSINETTWTDLGSVPASGNSTSPKSYSYVDVTAPAGIMLYYRLVAVQNESYFYSPIISTTGCRKTAIVQLAPVPATTTTNLSVYSEESFQATINLYGVDGRSYYQRQVTIKEGNNQFPIDVSRLTSGTYYLTLESPDGTRQSISLIKQ